MEPGLGPVGDIETGGELRDLASLPGLAVELAGMRRTRFAGDADGNAPIERFQWFLGVAFVLLVLQTLLTDGTRRAPFRRRARSLLRA